MASAQLAMRSAEIIRGASSRAPGPAAASAAASATEPVPRAAATRGEWVWVACGVRAAGATGQAGRPSAADKAEDDAAIADKAAHGGHKGADDDAAGLSAFHSLTRAEALSRKFREAESRWRLAPGALDSYEPSEYTRDDAHLFAFFSAALSGLAVLVASRSALPWLALAKARLLAQAAALASVRHGLKRAEYDAEVMRERAEIAETATNEARAEAARQLYVGFEDGKNLGTVVDEMRACPKSWRAAPNDRTFAHLAWGYGQLGDVAGVTATAGLMAEAGGASCVAVSRSNPDWSPSNASLTPSMGLMLMCAQVRGHLAVRAGGAAAAARPRAGTRRRGARRRRAPTARVLLHTLP